MGILQRMVTTGRAVFPRGWSPVLSTLGRVYARARLYPASMADGDRLFVDLREEMCHGLFLYGEQQHEMYTVALFEKVLAAGDVVLDIGANVGYLTRMIARRVGPSGVVHAFEPAPAALRLLEANTRDLEHATCHGIALSNTHGTATFSVRAKGDTSSIGAAADARDRIVVRVETIDRLFQDAPRIDFVKIDVEGYEWEVIDGAKSVLQRCKPLVYFEYLEAAAAERGFSLASFAELLEPLGYRLWWMNPAYPQGPMLRMEPSCYVLAVPAHDRWGIAAQRTYTPDVGQA